MFLTRMMTTRNVGWLDRLLRALPALAVVGLWWTGTLAGWSFAVAAVLAGMLLVTSITGACSIYYLLGFSTCPASRTAKD
jgi:hypothetical protein